MNKDKLQEIEELEQKFMEMSQHGHPNVIDTGLFLDSVCNVLDVLKKECREGLFDKSSIQLNSKIETLHNLYNSLKDFQSMYASCIHGFSF